MRPRPEFLRQKRNILTEFVHSAPSDGSASLDYRQRELICATEPPQLGVVVCKVPALVLPTTLSARSINPPECT
jgi:hypothetical protein